MSRHEATKKYLRQVRHMDNVITNRLKERERLHATLTNIGGVMKPDKVQTSGTKDRIGDGVTKLVALEGEIDSLIDKMVDTRRVILSQLESLSDTKYYQILYMRYIDDKSFGEISGALNVPERSVKRHHDKALDEFESRYGVKYLKKSMNVT